MEEINHFNHKEHPLRLIKNWEKTMGDAICCYGCQEPISDGSAYGCVPCYYFLHKICAELTLIINRSRHFKHPLNIHASYPQGAYCDVCKGKLFQKFGYRCFPCNFDVCIKCATIDATLQEARDVRLEHEGHPQHTLTLQLRPATFLCDACNAKDEDLFYQCNDCNFWIHKTCATLSPKIDLPYHHHHPLFLVYSLPGNFYGFSFYCEFCKEMIHRWYWIYHCANCRVFAHIKCALNAFEQPSTPRDGPDIFIIEEQPKDNLLHFPMLEAFTDPLKQLYFEKTNGDGDDNSDTEINHWSHDHPLILNVESQDNNKLDIGCNDPIHVCHGCMRPLSFPYYSCKDECPIFLHKYCVELPRTLKHQLHPNHSLVLVHFHHPYYFAHKCRCCSVFVNTFVYECEICKFYLDVNCAFLPNVIKHASHRHPLTQVIDPKFICMACNILPDILMSYACKGCDFHLDMLCAVMSPYSIAHRYCKEHQVILTYPPIEDHPEDFYCDICERLMHPKFPLYHCQKCKNSFHIYCIRRMDWFQNFKLEGTRHVSQHKHPITFTRKKKTPKFVCSNCNCDINGHLILECNARICNFKTCTPCYHEKGGWL